MYQKSAEPWLYGCKSFNLSLLILGLLMLLGAFQTALALAPVQIEETLTKVPVGKAAGYYLDQDRTLELSDVRQLAPDEWIKPEEESPSFGFNLAHLWVKLELHNAAPSPRRLVLEIAYPPLDEVEAHIVRGGVLAEQYAMGDTLSFAQRPIDHRHFVIPVPIGADESVTLYLKVSTEGTLQAPMKLWDQERFHAEQQYALIGQGLYFGIMLVMIVYNLFIYMTVRHASYLYYAGSVLAIACVVAALQGIGFQFVWPHLPEINRIAIPVSICAFGALACLFALSLLDIKARAPAVHGFVVFFAYFFSLMLLPAFLLPYHLSIRIIGVVAGICTFVAFFMGFYLWGIGVRVARFYTLAWSMLLGASFLTALSKLGVLPSTVWLEHSIQMGSAAEVVLLSFALADRINFERQEKLRAQQLALDAQTALATELDRMVSERTQALERANRRLEELSIQDGLTGIFNRRHFDELFKTEYRRAFREQCWISVLMIDVDYFKKLNDTLGHQFGDLCLKQVAETLQNLTRRPPDVVARYGGEEFILILPATDSEGAYYVADKIRVAIANLEILQDDQKATLTVSIGAASVVPSASDNHESLLKVADDNLYAAKRDGRNRVVVSEPQSSKRA